MTSRNITDADRKAARKLLAAGRRRNAPILAELARQQAAERAERDRVHGEQLLAELEGGES